MLVDTHAHLQWKSFDRDRDMAIERAREAGVKEIINVGFNIEGCREAVKLARIHDGLHAAVGIHPHIGSQVDGKTLNEIRQLSKGERVVAIGEIGLDYYRNLSPRKDQQRAFEDQLNLAKEEQLPVVIHNREAHADILKMIAKFRGEICGVMHCFSGNKEMAMKCIELGFYISFAGSITFPSAHILRDTVRSTSLDRIVLETDSPWLAPQDKRGKRNEPAFLPLVAKCVAELKGIPVKELAEKTTNNAHQLFRLH